MAASSLLDVRRRFQWFRAALIAVLIYVASSGPILAIAFKLRDVTNWDGFYLAMWLYFPLLWLQWIVGYINWWLDLFATKWPG